jgi:Fic family protein
MALGPESRVTASSAEKYTELLLRVSQTGDYLSWVRFFLEAVEGSALESVTRAEALLALRDRYHQRLHSARSSVLLLIRVSHGE